MRLLTAVSLLSVAMLQALLVTLLVRKRVVNDFPFFFSYTVFAVVTGLTKFFVRDNPVIYYYAFLATEPIYALLGYLAIAEVFYYVFKTFYRVWWFKFLFPAFGILAL